MSAPFKGTVNVDIRDSVPDWTPFEPPKAPEGAPSVVYVVLDDVGFSALGCYGGPVDTPNIDRLAAEGVRYTQWHTTALCSPTRSCLLTGRNHTRNSMACITEAAIGFPNASGTIPPENGTLPEILGELGWNTYMVGKWHLCPEDEMNLAATRRNWPIGRGFERWYGFLGAETNQWYPDLVYDNHSIEQPAQPEDGYHLSADLADKAIEFIQDAHVNAPDKPFYLHYCPGAGHAPHHVSKEWADKYKGRFDSGWDEYRKVVHQRQLEMGILPAGTALSEHDPDVPEWDTLPENARKLYTRMMEVYAGFVSYTDHEFGRVVSFLEEIGELDNTLFILISDNGASPEGGPVGSLNEMMFFNGVPESIEDNLERIDELGGPNVFNHYAWGWTNAGNTPFRRWKRETYRGGTTDPCIVSWPAKITARGEIRTQYGHIIDLVPTVLDALGVQPPATIRGVTQAPIEGVSFAHTFNDAEAATRHHTQYFEMFGHRSIYPDGWRAVCPWPGPTFTEAAEKGRQYGSPIDAIVLADIEANDWELYDLTTDYAETNNVAADHRDKVIEMIGRWWAEAGKHDVLPIDGSMLERLRVERPTIAEARDRFVYYPGGSPVPFTAAPKVYNRAFSITADVQVPEAGAEGVLVAQGGRTGGYSFFVKDSRLHFVYNFLGRDFFTVTSNTEVPIGDVSLRYEFEPSGEPDFQAGKGVPANGQLYIDKKLVGAVDMPHTVPNLFSTEGLTCGHSGGSCVAPDDYQDAFPFTGTLKRVTFDLSGDLIVDADTDIKVAMARQ